MEYNKNMIEELAIKGEFIGGGYPVDGFAIFNDENGKIAKEFLESKGFTVVKNYDTGRNGLAITECGIHLSTNGYLYKK